MHSQNLRKILSAASCINSCNKCKMSTEEFGAHKLTRLDNTEKVKKYLLLLFRKVTIKIVF